jgi:MFS family permease
VIGDATPSARGLLEIARAPGAAMLAGASLVARLPRGMAALAIVLLVHDATGSYATAGAAGAALAVGDAAVSPLQGRLIDRLGQARVLVPSAVLYAGALTALSLTPAASAPAVSAMLAGVAGMAFPPVSASMKTLWPQLARTERLLFAAYAMESLIQQSIFLLGPLLVAALVAIGSASLALMTTAAFALGGTLAFVALPPSRAWRPATARRGGRSPLREAPARVLTAITLIQSVALGARTVAIPAFAYHHGHPNAAGLLLAVLNVGALAGVPLGAAAPASGGPVRRYQLACALLAVSAAPVVFAASLGQAAVTLAASGVFIAPTAAASYVLVDRVTRPDRRTEAFTWMSTAVACGTALGSAGGGLATQLLDVRAALLLAFASVAIAALASFASAAALGRGTSDAARGTPTPVRRGAT